MSCTSCQNCSTVLPDGCIVYTGPSVPALALSQGDSSLAEVENALITKILALLSGEGITLSPTSSCSALSTAISGDLSLSHLIQVYGDQICSLTSSVASLSGQVNAPFSFDTGCLTVAASPSRDQILQAALTALCAHSSVLSLIQNDYVKASQLNALIAQYLSPAVGSTAVVQENTKMSKYVAYPYHGPLTVFDSSGVGRLSMGYDKIYVCNGQTANGFKTPDYRGYSPIGANIGVPGGALDPLVDPSLSANAGYSIAQNAKKGEYAHTLSIQETPAHSHGVTDPGHQHGLPTPPNELSGGPNPFTRGGTASTIQTNSATTGISINAAGGSQSHNTLHPVVGAVYIIYIP